MKILMGLLITGMILSTVIGCTKEPTTGRSGGGNNSGQPPSHPPPDPAVDTVKGKEYVFSDLVWTLAGPGFVADTEIWIGVDHRTDLFGVNRAMEVSVMFDTTNYWTVIPKWDYPNIPANTGFLYGTIYGMALYIESYPLKYALVGRRASMKVKFL